MQKNEKDVFGEDVILYLELHGGKPRNARQLYNKVCELLDVVIRSFDDKKQISENDRNKKMVAFIEENYSQDIGLQNVAEYMNMSQGYVSKLFKSMNGLNFKEYLTKIRIEKATEILKEYPEKKVSDVAAEVGYSSIDSFMRAFSKLTGYSPTVYRTLNKKEQ